MGCRRNGGRLNGFQYWVPLIPIGWVSLISFETDWSSCKFNVVPEEIDCSLQLLTFCSCLWVLVDFARTGDLVILSILSFLEEQIPTITSQKRVKAEKVYKPQLSPKFRGFSLEKVGEFRLNPGSRTKFANLPDFAMRWLVHSQFLEEQIWEDRRCAEECWKRCWWIGVFWVHA